VLIKGSDYRIDQVVGAPLVAAYGGRVLLVDLVADLSTSASLAHAESGAA
jgi:D-beta-D-heptose 7-phosphate kinase/D-beta-D-heptose 1-phosphate adenosyltransferase